jgi:hypothetical protein
MGYSRTPKWPFDGDDDQPSKSGVPNEKTNHVSVVHFGKGYKVLTQ